ncbi:MAG: hypothetical protein Tsb0021_09930 [Chlamydiales bacterium]
MVKIDDMQIGSSKTALIGTVVVFTVTLVIATIVAYSQPSHHTNCDATELYKARLDFSVPFSSKDQKKEQ